MDGCFYFFSAFFECLGKIFMCSRMLGFQAGRLVQVGQGLFRFSGQQPEFSTVVHRLELLRSELYSPVQAFFRFFHPVFIEEGHSLAYPGIHVFRVQLQGLVVVGLCGPRVVRFGDALVAHQSIRGHISAGSAVAAAFAL